MKLRLLTLLALLAGLGAASYAGARTLFHTSSRPYSVRFVHVPGYELTIEGDHWGGGAQLAVALSHGYLSNGPLDIVPVRGLELRADPAGTFRVAVNGVDLCGFVAIGVHDFAGHRLFSGVAPSKCDAETPGYTPPHTSARLTLLDGSPVNPRVVSISFRPTPSTLTVHVGDVIRFRQTKDTFDLLPDTDSMRLALVESVPPCPFIGDCAAHGFLWGWVAVKPGVTSIWFTATLRCDIHLGRVCRRPPSLARVRVVRR